MTDADPSVHQDPLQGSQEMQTQTQTAPLLTYDQIEPGMILYLNGGPVAALVKQLLQIDATRLAAINSHRFPFIVVRKDEKKREFISLPFLAEEMIQDEPQGQPPQEGNTSGGDDDATPGRLPTQGPIIGLVSDAAHLNTGEDKRERKGLVGSVDARYLRCFVPSSNIEYEEGMQKIVDFDLKAVEDTNPRGCRGWVFMHMAISSPEKMPDGLIQVYERATDGRFEEASAEALFVEYANGLNDLRLEIISMMQNIHDS